MDIHAIIFGATGHIGQGLLIECLGNPDVKSVLTIGRRPAGKQDAKLKEISHNDFTNFDALAEEMTGYNACFFCLGVSSAGMSEEKYHLITHDYAVSAAKVLSHQNPQMTFCFISGSGADETLQSRLMWARVKGKAENSLKAL
ncbi:MAG: epimerase, partial [Saprospiraceae bacterium]|nr:epimerase [Saprospiraceae bacterium]